ncbi:MAG TPA: non-heme iron oxygenase ferredoxin subunit [Novosphingobium sp.]|nr:non-heme iron oxygenase ferredoxin subunit [Novosphingobium sp.]
MTLVKACNADALKPGEMMAVDAKGLPPVALYNIDGEFLATSNVCSHAVAMLTDGYIDGDQIECPMHGGMFDIRTGAATHFPCVEPLRTFRVELRDGAVFIDAG